MGRKAGVQRRPLADAVPNLAAAAANAEDLLERRQAGRAGEKSAKCREGKQSLPLITQRRENSAGRGGRADTHANLLLSRSHVALH